MRVNMKIYLDVFFLVNGCLNTLVLLAECMIKKQKFRPGRIIPAASAGAFLAVVILVGRIHTYKILFVPVYFFGIFLVVYIAFGKTTFQVFIGNVVMYFVMSAVLASVLVQMQNLTGTGGISLLLLGCTVFSAAACHFLPLLYKRKEMEERYYRIWILYKGEKISGTGLLDTGNQLLEPVSQEPVAVLESDFIPDIWKKDMIFRYIPYHAIGTEEAVMKAFRADEICVVGEKNRKWKLIKPWIALAEEKISANNEYQVILHPDMISAGTKTE
jgi:stage II sporulation protein GA (sporulation sigma-E factor processing peptidase)